MHTFKGSQGAVFNYNGDFSGEIFIKDIADNEVKIASGDILDFVAYCYVQSKKIEKLEQSDPRELLIGNV